MPGIEQRARDRPSPEALLETATREERAQLRIFLGSAPGVGKTYAMLEAARERQRAGVDVVVGIVETHGRSETEALLDSLESVPRRPIEYRGKALQEMDIDAILARRPQIVLVDELAHTNAPESRHPKRYADVEELLEAGIEVYTTVNIQHLETLNDVVARITGVRVRETVPDVIIERADEIKLIDLPPEDLIRRLREGKVYLPPQAARAIESYFTPGNLTALRELALRHAAERVDDQVQRYMQAHAIAGPWAVSERILVGVSESGMAERLVRAAGRMAARRRAQWLAVFVEPASFHRRPEAERERAGRALRLAERLGGEAVTLPGRDVAAELLRFARERNVSEIILGKPHLPWWRELWRRSPIDEIIRRSGDIEVRLIPTEQASPLPRGHPRAPHRLGSAAGYSVALVMTVLAGLGGALLQSLIALRDPSMVFLTGVLFTAVVGGLGPSLVASVASLLVYDFFFVPPIFSLTVTNPQDIVVLVVFLIVAVLTSQLTARARDEADAATQRESRTAALYDFSRQIAGAAGLDDLLPVIVSHVTQLFQADVVVLLPDGPRVSVRARHPDDLAIGEAEAAAASWVWQNGEPAGPGTDTLPGGSWLFVPIATARGAVGVLGVHTSEPGKAFALERRQLLEALARQAAVAIERTRIDVVLEEKAKTDAVMEAIEDGLVVLDPAGVVIDVNEVACAILEVGESDVRGKRFDDLATTHPHYLRVREAVREFRARPDGGEARLELALFMRGRDHHFVLRPTPWRVREGEPEGLILALQDVTYFRDQEARREHLVATLSHELGTPITSIRMAIELLGKSASRLDPELRELVDTALLDVVRLQDVARQFVDLARTRAMAIALDRQQIDVAHLVGRAARIFALQAREKGIALEVESPPSISIPGDETKLTWALSNLLANALRYTPSGGKIRIDVETSDDTVTLSVADTGPGIPVDQQERIFERFTQSAASGEIGSAGLGLAIVRDIVQAHGGRIRLESTPGQGTHFSLELPRG